MLKPLRVSEPRQENYKSVVSLKTSLLWLPRMDSILIHRVCEEYMITLYELTRYQTFNNITALRKL